MELYHGSVDIVRTPQFGYGRKRNDYGLGFYCTQDKNLAKEWAVTAYRDEYVNIYRLETDTLSLMNLNSPEYNILHWLVILLQNRVFDLKTPLASQGKAYLLKTFPVEYQKYDLIYGYRADDSYFAFAQDFLSGAISLRQLSNAMYLGNLGNQMVLKSRKAFNAIIFLDCERVNAKEWFPKGEERDKQARHEYLNIERYSFAPDDIFITDILRERMNEHDPRLQRPVFAERTDEPCEDVGFFEK